ncbi:MAG: hypothetical protein ABIR11_04705, partial [Candidatus Limnocylindrales bacterium]
LSQVAPGVYESPIASLDSGAYAVRVTQVKAGEQALGRTLGLVAPTPAEYRLLGANEPLLAAIRNATGGVEVTTPDEVWVHDLQTTSRYTDLWPWLLVLALLLWPLDIALRRVSLGRRELADGRRWVSDRVRGRRVAGRTQQTEDLFAARGRAGSAGARSAILRQAAEESEGVVPVGATAVAPANAPAATPHAVPTRLPAPPPASPVRPTSPLAAAPLAPPSAPAASGPPPAPSAAVPTGADDTLARLREAKRRTRG